MQWSESDWRVINSVLGVECTYSERALFLSGLRMVSAQAPMVATDLWVTAVRLGPGPIQATRCWWGIG
jgi:hypothetical protein